MPSQQLQVCSDAEAEKIPEELLLGQFIPLHYHFNMLQDRARMDPFREAIDCVVPPGGTILELGGGTGVLSYFAAQTAARVWCVERNPALVRAARGFLSQNQHGDRVQVIQADAMTYLPPEPVDVVICEMLHVAMIREKQLEVLRSFKERYTAKFGPQLPQFIPDASLLAVQLMNQDFEFGGYRAPVPMFSPPGSHPESCYLSDAQIYSTIYYQGDIPTDFELNQSVPILKSGTLTALCFLTKNFLAFQLAAGQAVQWMMHQLILPLAEPLEVRAGETVQIHFAYAAGCRLEDLQQALVVTRQAMPNMLRRAA